VTARTEYCGLVAIQRAGGMAAWFCMLTACTELPSVSGAGGEAGAGDVQTSQAAANRTAGESAPRTSGGAAGSGGSSGSVTAAGSGGSSASAGRAPAAPISGSDAGSGGAATSGTSGGRGGSGQGEAGGAAGSCSPKAQPAGVVCYPDCRTCPAPEHGRAVCDGPACAVACDSYYHVCDGRCASDSALESCGSRCEPCPTSPNGTTICSAGACKLMCNEASRYCPDDNACPRLERGWNDDSDRDSWLLRVNQQPSPNPPAVVTNRSSEGAGSIAVPIAVLKDGGISFGVSYCEAPFDLRGKKVSMDVYFEGPAVNASVGLRATILTPEPRRIDTYLNGGESVGGGGLDNPPANMWLTLTSNDSAQVAEWLQYVELIELRAVFGSSWSGTVYFDNLRVR
jgi:hypothetical protein